MTERFTHFFFIWEKWHLHFHWPQAISLFGRFVWYYHLNCSWEDTDLGWMCQLITTHMFYHCSIVADGSATHQTGYTRSNSWQHDSSFSALFFCIPISLTTYPSLWYHNTYTQEKTVIDNTVDGKMAEKPTMEWSSFLRNAFQWHSNDLWKHTAES